MANQVSNQVKQQVISQYIKTAAGRAKLAASMIQPLRLRRDYTAVGRKTFAVEQLPDGALPIYDKDPEVTAFVVGMVGTGLGLFIVSQLVEQMHGSVRAASHEDRPGASFVVELPMISEDG